jgi:hypothetical protein
MVFAMLASLFVHLLFLACFVGYPPKFVGKGGGTGEMLEIRLGAIPGKGTSIAKVLDKISDTHLAESLEGKAAPLVLAESLEGAEKKAAPSVLHHAAPIPNGSSLPRSSEELEADNLPPGKDEAIENTIAKNDADERDESFFPGSLLSVPPVRVVDSSIDDLLVSFEDRLAQGRYFLRLYINRDGQVVEVQGSSSLDSENSDPIFEQLIAAFKSVRFLPAEINGHAVNSQIGIEINAVDERPESSKASGEYVKMQGAPAVARHSAT